MIHLTTLGALQPGDFICGVDNDALTTDEEINRDYREEDQEWLEVLALRGQADVGTMKLRSADGSEFETHSCSWSEAIWKRVS